MRYYPRAIDPADYEDISISAVRLLPYLKEAGRQFGIREAHIMLAYAISDCLILAGRETRHFETLDKMFAELAIIDRREFDAVNGARQLLEPEIKKMVDEGVDPIAIAHHLAICAATIRKIRFGEVESRKFIQEMSTHIAYVKKLRDLKASLN